MTTNASQIDLKSVNVIKGLIMDTVHASNSGHPGGAMSSADFAYVLFREFLNFDPADAKWFNRDRFVLSAGHESALLYALLTLRGILTVDDLKAFRQFGSKTPGHPEHDMTDGVEATTGPLGQGFAMAGGMAVAETFLRSYLDAETAGHHTYVLVSDGDVQEPIFLGSAALFGQWGLGKLIAYYDSNKIQLAGPTCRVDNVDYKSLFESMHWQVIEIDGHDHEAIRQAILAGQAETTKPTIIIGHTTMAKGCATLEGSESTHGSPLPEAEIKATKIKLGLPDEEFHLPADVLAHFRSRFEALSAGRAAWDKALAAKLADPAFAEKWKNATQPVCERSLTWPEFETGASVATRKAFGASLNAMMEQLPTLMGGSADLDPSNQTEKFRVTAGIFNATTNPAGRNLCFGVREFPMGAILNGLALHGGIVPFGATFLVFSDYERNAIRMSALQHLPVLHVFTHDSFFVGEGRPDPPAHRARQLPAPDPEPPGPAPGRRPREHGLHGRGPEAEVPPVGARLHPPGPAGPRPAAAPGGARGQGRLRGARPRGRSPRNPPAGLGLRGASGRGGRQGPAGDEDPRGLGAEHGALRRAERRVQGIRHAPLRHAPRGHRGRPFGHLVQVRGPGRKGLGHRPLRRLGPGGRAEGEIRLHGRQPHRIHQGLGHERRNDGSTATQPGHGPGPGH